MTQKEKVSVSWSGGKDCALALYFILEEGKYEVASLHTTIDFTTKKVGLHGIPETLIEKQAHLLNIPLDKIYLNNPEKPLTYEEQMLEYYDILKSKNIHKIISGDIFLEDLRAYKEQLAGKKDIKIDFPLWGYSSMSLLEELIHHGFLTMICAADLDIFSPEVVGKTIDGSFLKNLPEGVDPCGEKGEFHSFIYDGPIFKKKIKFVKKGIISEKHSFKTSEGEILVRNFCYADLA